MKNVEINSMPTNEEIVQWSNNIKDNGLTATGTRIATSARCEGANWMKEKASSLFSEKDKEAKQAIEHLTETFRVNLEAKDKELKSIRGAEKGILEKLLSTDGALQDAKAQIEKLTEERDELRQGQQGLLQYQQKLLSELSSLKSVTP